MMQLSGIQLSFSAQRLTRDAFELIRSMVGREIRATVVSSTGSQTGALITLRSGGALIEARVQGAQLAPGQKLFLKVMQDAPGRYRLVVLEPGGAGQGVPAMPVLPPFFSSGPLAGLFTEYLRFYHALRSPAAKPRPGVVPQTEAGTQARATAGAVELQVLERMRQSLGEMTAQLPGLEQGALAAFLQAGALGPDSQLPDFFFPQGWGPAGDEAAENQDPAEEYVACTGNLSESPAYFLAEIALEHTGRVNALLLSPDRDFHRLSLWLQAEQPETVRQLRQARGRLRELIGPGVEWEQFEILGAPDDENRAMGGSLLDLQG